MYQAVPRELPGLFSTGNNYWREQPPTEIAKKPRFGEVNLTPEEQEDLRKREERKDRIKIEKRRKMEAKKAALRA